MRYRGKHRVVRRRRRVLRIIAVTLAALILMLTTAAYAIYRKLDGNISEISMADMGQRADNDVDDGEALNILLLGSDTRKGTTGVLGEEAAGLSDTTILLHLSSDRKRAYGVSVPRDLMVQRPECQAEDGSGTVAGGFAMWNAAYALAGPLCTVKQFEAMTDIHVDHVVIVNFNGFRDMVDALGGVTICVPEEVNDTHGGIHLKAGTYEVNGKKALDYVRVRNQISANGDIGRMKRQQVFLAAMANKAISAGTLLNPAKLLSFLDAATKSITTDSELSSLTKLIDLGNQFKGIGLSKIQFLTMPIEAYPADRNRLQAGEGADDLWERIRLDKPLTSKQVKEATDATGGVAGGPIEVTPAEIDDSTSDDDDAIDYGLPLDPETIKAEIETAQRDAQEKAEAAAEIARRNGLCA